MRLLKDLVFSEWEARVRENITQAAKLTYPILTDSLPELYRGIADAIESISLSSYQGLSRSIGTEHGNERARATAYDLAAVINEYHILRRVVLDVLEEHCVVFNTQELRILNAMIDMSISEAATGFATVQSIFRERFVATLAHDLRTPLSASHMAAQMISRASNSEEIKRLAARIETNSIRMNGMIEDLLDNVTWEAGVRLHLELKEYNLCSLMQEVIEELSEFHTARVLFDGESVKGWWAFEPMRRAFENLLGNALKYGSNDHPILVNLSVHYSRVIVTVHNSGPAIPTSQMQSIFMTFQRAKQSVDKSAIGWGLGLPYVRSVVESHGGSIKVQSTVEQGTTFTIDLPIDTRLLPSDTHFET